jgi:hypothetical protein
MTMQASGLIKFSDIMNEIDSDENPFRLGHANNGIYETINITNSNANKPDTVDPDKISEWYKYQHNASVSTTPLYDSNNAASGATGSIIVSTGTYVTWSASTSASWITISSSSSSGTGNGTVSYTIASNSGSSRSATVVVTFTVGTTSGSHPSGTNSSTTRSTTVSQNAGSGGDDDEGLDEDGGRRP